MGLDETEGAWSEAAPTPKQPRVPYIAQRPLMEDQPVGTVRIVRAEAKKPLERKIPFFMSGMSFGSLSGASICNMFI